MRRRLGLGAAAIAGVLAFGGYALAQSGDDPGASACADHHPCAIVNQLAADGAAAKLATGDELLAAQIRPVGECPEAAAVYDRGKVEVDAVLGPCPSIEEAQDHVLSLADPAHQANYELAIRDLGKPR
jgi:hypothetical protein